MSIALPSNERRALGIYYTPNDAAHFMAQWAYRDPSDLILEPSLGGGSFVKAVRDVATLRSAPEPRWIAAELEPGAADAATSSGLVSRDQLRVGDFLSLKPVPVSAAIANPPYVRLRNLPADQRDRALRVARHHLGEDMGASGSIWMPFVAHMAAFIRPGGRLAAVLPLDFTYVAYARPLWRHLSERFGELRVIRSRERLFPEINQDVLILLADEKGGRTEVVRYESYETVADISSSTVSRSALVSVDDIVDGKRTFQRALLSPALRGLLDGALRGVTEPAGDSARFHIGYVSGDREYFHPGDATVAAYQIPRSSLRDSLTSGRALRGRGLRTSAMSPGEKERLWLPGAALTAGEERYIASGQVAGVDRRYKCRVRAPWYLVPGVRTPDFALTVFSERPLLVVNDADWVASNSLVCGYLSKGTADEFARRWYNSLTLLNIGLEVHSLGGGVMVLVPNEASAVGLVKDELAAPDLRRVEDKLMEGDVLGAYRSGDSALAKGLGTDVLQEIEQGVSTLARWRSRPLVEEV